MLRMGGCGVVRSIFPCQDAPAVKMTYEAHIEAPAWATVLMSALRQPSKETVGKDGRRTYVWSQPVPIPSYLVALAVGELDSRDISARCVRRVTYVGHRRFGYVICRLRGTCESYLH